MENAESRTASRSYTADLAADPKRYGSGINSADRSPIPTFVGGGSPCPETKVINARRKRRLGFAVSSQSIQAAPQFVQPSSIYYKSLRTTSPQQNRGPRRKQIQLQPSKAEIMRNNASRRDKLKPYVLEPSPQAQRYPQSNRQSPQSTQARGLRFCGFYPWRGNHQEDIVNDTYAKLGSFDKLSVAKQPLVLSAGSSQSDLVSQALNQEQSSARLILGPAFKQRNGLRTLSWRFSEIMARRRMYSTVTTPSTFKPPPRVTLPEQKREAWLRDLANPMVPLRKLSRTIPHGLKGPSLLDQCATKQIPTARAVWFVRCVGANELRGLRRKGVGSLAVGGESKWIKEWTGQLTQFLEKTIGACMTMADDLWQAKMHYSIRLAAYLYAEHLLDRTGFLEWYLSFLDGSSMDVLPFALVLATMFWDDLMKLRRFSKRFAEIILTKSEIVMANNTDSQCLSLLRRLSIMASNMLLSHRESLVGSGDWERLNKLLVVVDHRLGAAEICLENVASRNIPLYGLKGGLERPSKVSGRRKAVDYLDNLTLPYNTKAIYRRLSSLLSGTELVSCIFEWAVTSLRTGQHRVYLGADLLRYAASEPQYLDIQTPILELLSNIDVHIKVKRHDLFLLISELVRTRYFSIGTYLKWLIAKGVMSKINCLDESSPCYVRLLAEIPMHTANTMHRNLRNTLLKDRSFDCSSEERSVIEIREILSSKGMFNMSQHTPPDKYPGLFGKELERIRSLTRTAKSELALWLKASFQALVTKEQPGQSGWPNLALNTMPTTQFILIRQVLEELGDMIVLVEVIMIVLASDNWDILTLAADTIIFNLETFCVLHPLEDFIQRLYSQYKKLQMQPSQQPLIKGFLSTFIDLLHATNIYGAVRRELENASIAYHSQYPRSTVARSPVSDDFLDDISDVDMMDSNEEVERLWNIGAVVEKPDLSRIFETTVSNMETSFDDADNQHHILSATKGFTKLRQFDTDFFDDLSQRWVGRMQSCTNRMPLFRAFSSLIAASCLKIETLAETALKTLSQHNEGAISAFDGGIFVILVLDLIVHENPFNTALSAKEFYTLKRKRKTFATNSCAEILQLFRQVIELCGLSQDEDLRQRVLRLVSSISALELLRGFATQNLDLLKVHLVEPLLQPGKSQYISWLHLLVDNLLDDNDCNDNTEVDAHVQVASLLDLANDFSIGLCKLKMQIILNADLNSASFSGESTTAGNTIARSFIRGIASASHDRRKICTDLVTVLNKDCASKIRADVEELFLDWSTFFRTRQLIDQLDLPLAHDHATGESLARAFLSVVEATSTSVPTAGSHIASSLVERMAKLLQMISNRSDDDDNGTLPDFSCRNREAREEFRCWFVLLMRLIVLHRPAFAPPPKSTTAASADQARMLAGLCCLLQHDMIRHDESHFELVLGVAASFCDGLPDDTRLQLKRYCKAKKVVPMGSYLMGAKDGAESLRALQKGKKPLEFAAKAWERLAEPTPNIGENDVTLSLALFRARRF